METSSENTKQTHKKHINIGVSTYTVTGHVVSVSTYTVTGHVATYTVTGSVVSVSTSTVITGLGDLRRTPS